MSVWYLTPASISYMAQVILALSIGAYMAHLTRKQWAQRAETLPTALLTGFFLSLAVFSTLLFLNVSLNPRLRLYALYWEIPAVALVFLLLLQFAYHFPSLSPRQIWESRIILGLSLGYFLWESGYAIYRLGLLAGQDVVWRYELSDVPLVLSAVWLMVVLVRQTIRTSNEHTRQAWWQALWRPQGQAARAIRGFTLIFSSFLLLTVLELAHTYQLIPSEMREILLSLVLLLALFAFALVYLNAVPETTTFMIRLVGIALVTILAIMGAVGWLIFPSYLDRYPADTLFQREQTLRFSPNAQGGYDIRPVSFSYETELGTRLALHNDDRQEVDLAFSFPFFGEEYDAVYVLDDGVISLGEALDFKDILSLYGPTPAIFALFMNLDPEPNADGGGIFVRSEPDALTLTWYRVPVAGTQTAYTFQATLYPDGVFDINYIDAAVQPADIYDSADMNGVVGVVPGGLQSGVEYVNLVTDVPYTGGGSAGVVDNLFLRLRHDVHRLYFPLACIILASSLIIAVAFPMFFWFSLVRPLNTLLDGVRRVNDGDLQVTMPVQYRDEIGFLTTSFNGMVAELRALVANLEARVAERTQQLEQQAIDLAQARDAAEAANRAKSVFLANMSHELRTPLNAIMGFSELMVRDATFSPAERENLATINRSGEHLLAIINDVLELSKIEAGRVSVQEEAFDLHRLLGDMESMFRLRAEKKALALSVEYSPDVPHYVRADQGKLRQVLINLLGNAVKFTHEGEIGLRVGRLPTPAPENPPAARCPLRFEVFDTGIGIAPEEQTRIFDAFVQTDAGLHAQEGSGLGLTISREFLRIMGSDITVISQVGKGSAFRFDLQVALPEPAEILSLQSTAHRIVMGLAPGQPVYRLLVVEDVRESRDLLVRMLEKWGFDVRPAENGVEAVAIWREWQPHLVWMDMRLPVMDGHEATREIKAAPEGRSTIVIALTASAFEEDRERILASGCDDVLHKPFRQQDLAAMLAKYLGVTFEYQQAKELDTARLSERLHPLDLADLPDEWRAELRQAAIEADGDKVAALAELIQAQHPKLAATLVALARSFDYESILTATGKAGQGDSHEQ